MRGYKLVENCVKMGETQMYGRENSDKLGDGMRAIGKREKGCVMVNDMKGKSKKEQDCMTVNDTRMDGRQVKVYVTDVL